MPEKVTEDLDISAALRTKIRWESVFCGVIYWCYMTENPTRLYGRWILTLLFSNNSAGYRGFGYFSVSSSP